MNNKLKKVINEALEINKERKSKIINRVRFSIFDETAEKDSRYLSINNYVANFWERLYVLISNPFYYLFKGKWRI